MRALEGKKNQVIPYSPGSIKTKKVAQTKSPNTVPRSQDWEKGSAGDGVLMLVSLGDEFGGGSSEGVLKGGVY